jgi:AhpD family alkylhydroperoxidase
MSWINIVTGRLRELHERIAGPGIAVDNVLQVHGLRPHTLEGHMALYKTVLHHGGNNLPKWLLETIGLYVSLLNGCTYCVEHHFAGLSRLVKDDDRLRRIRHALETGDFEKACGR